MTKPVNTLEQKRDKLKKSSLGRLLLSSAAFVYGLIVKVRAWLYAKGQLKVNKLSIPVVCVGNLSTGGTGKTPAIVAITSLLLKENKKVGVLSRGYKRKKGGREVIVIAEGEEPNPDLCGDEPLMLARELANRVPVFVSPDRFAAGTIAEYQYGCDILIMDDGFQHFKLKRNADIVLVNAASPFTEDKLLPYGNLRESPCGLKRATVVLLTHCELAKKSTLEKLRQSIREYTSAPIIESSHKSLAFIKADTKETYPKDFLSGISSVALSGIGSPRTFEENLRRLGVKIKQAWQYPDHHTYSEEELMSARNAAGNSPIITTFKDFARFPANWKDLIGSNVYLLKIAMQLEKSDEQSLISMLLELKS